MLIDIAVNITDKQFEKNYEEIILDCKKEGILPIFIGTDYESSIKSLELAKRFNTMCYLGIHPTSKGNFNDLTEFLSEENVIAVGECGLDYDRLNFTSKEYQFNNFMTHLDYKSEKYFFHCRNAHSDFIKMAKGKKGVVHSFTGSIEEMNELLENDFYIGINGCMFKTQEGIEVIKRLPLERLLVETDAPYCKIRKSSPVYEFIKYKNNEKKWLRKNVPLTVKQVVECISEIKGINYEELERITVENTVKCFGEKVNFFIKRFFE